MIKINYLIKPVYKLGREGFLQFFFIILEDSLLASRELFVNPTPNPNSEALLCPIFEVSIIRVF
jgi:hypothetical protein